MKFLLLGLIVSFSSIHNNQNTFLVTAYCCCEICNGKWKGLVSDGHSMEYYKNKGYRIVAVDPEVIPLYSFLMWNDKVYYAVDVGKDVKGNHIDILLDNHASTIRFGRKENQIVTILGRGR